MNSLGKEKVGGMSFLSSYVTQGGGGGGVGSGVGGGVRGWEVRCALISFCFTKSFDHQPPLLDAHCDVLEIRTCI